MALDVEVGTFDKPTGTSPSPQDITVGFDPKALIIWCEKNATTNADSGASSAGCIGIVDDADNNVGVSINDTDGVANVISARKYSTTNALQLLVDQGTTLDVQAAITLGTAKFTLTYSQNDGGEATKIHWMAFGGSDITGTRVSTFTKTTAAEPVEQSIDVIDSDVKNITEGEGILFLITSNLISETASNQGLNYCLGWATRTVTESGAVTITEDNGNGTGDCRNSYQEADFILQQHNKDNGGIVFFADFVGFDADGFNINFHRNDNKAVVIPYLIIKGGKWESGNETHKITTTGTKATTTAFQPKGLLVVQNQKTAVGRGNRHDISFNFGAADGTTIASGGITDEDGAATINVGIMSSITKITRQLKALDQSVLSESDLDSFNSTDFTLNYTTVDANAYKFLWLVCGDLVAPPAVVQPKSILMREQTV